MLKTNHKHCIHYHYNHIATCISNASRYCVHKIENGIYSLQEDVKKRPTSAQLYQKSSEENSDVETNSYKEKISPVKYPQPPLRKPPLSPQKHIRPKSANLTATPPQKISFNQNLTRSPITNTRKVIKSKELLKNYQDFIKTSTREINEWSVIDDKEIKKLALRKPKVAFKTPTHSRNNSENEIIFPDISPLEDNHFTYITQSEFDFSTLKSGEKMIEELDNTMNSLPDFYTEKYTIPSGKYKI